MKAAEALEIARQQSRCVDAAAFTREFKALNGENMPPGLARAWAYQLAITGGGCSV